VRIQTGDFNLSEEVAALSVVSRSVGAVASFVGYVRAQDAGPPAAGGVEALELEHYPGMTERAIEAMIDAAFERFPVLGARVVHRVGRLELGEQIVLVAVSASHRGVAFEACEFLMDYLKTQAPFWKKEFTADGSRWVEARSSDDAAAARWGLQSCNAEAGGRVESP
jgi:molybdopterin synthase catalytic subunit